MADIFLSYAREDAARARVLADALTLHHWTVFWDRRIPHGSDFNAYIEKQINDARCIVVLWSAAAIDSKFVRDEATEGLNDRRLVPAFIEHVKQPLGFRQLQAADLTDWTGGTEHEEFRRLLESISAIAPPGVPATLQTGYNMVSEIRPAQAVNAQTTPVVTRASTGRTASWDNAKPDSLDDSGASAGRPRSSSRRLTATLWVGACGALASLIGSSFFADEFTRQIGLGWHILFAIVATVLWGAAGFMAGLRRYPLAGMIIAGGIGMIASLALLGQRAGALQAALILAAPCAGMVGAMFGFVLQPSRDSTNPDAK